MKQKTKHIIAGLLAVTLIASALILAPIQNSKSNPLALDRVRTDKATVFIARSNSPDCAWFREMVD